MQVTLHLVKGNPKGKQVEVPEGALTIGRAEESSLIIASTRVSRNHCEIVNDGRTLTLRDKGSANGSYVNGKRVDEQRLKAGDRVQIGPLTFLVEVDGRRESAPEAAPKPAPPKPPAKPAPAKAAPSAAAKPPAKKPTPAAAVPPKPAAPAKPAPATRAPARGTNDILASLERLAEKRGPGAPSPDAPTPKDEEILEISDEDLLGEGNS
jgi:pSer/pThr/pTyr-binding forkhead associated (FHA) protein